MRELSPDIRVVAGGLRFPEGPVALPDGSVLVVEIAGGTLTRVAPDGTVDRIVDVGGGPNGAAIGADGAVYIANNGRAIGFRERDGMFRPDYAPDRPPGTSGSLQRVDLGSGAVETVYEACDGRPLLAPNDLVVAADGSIWFTDLGLVRPRSIERGGVYWCRPDGSEIREVIHPLDQPNGIGLSPDGRRLYVAETTTGRLWAWDVAAPGEVAGRRRPATAADATLLADPGRLTRFDSLAVDGEGWICVARIGAGAIVAVAPGGQDDGMDVVATPDPYTTNICFGPDRRTAFVTLSSTGRLVSFEWHRPGGATAF